MTFEAQVLVELQRILVAIQQIGGVTQDHKPAYQNRSLLPAEIMPEGVGSEHVLEDGSTWVLDQGKLKGLIYGYISKEKDPALWDQMVTAFNGDETHLIDTLGIARAPYLRWKQDPRALVASTQDMPTLRFQLAQMLSNPLPPMVPTR